MRTTKLMVAVILHIQKSSKNMRIKSLIFGFCFQFSILMVYLMIKHRNKPVLVYKEPWMQENGINKFRKIVSEVSYYVQGYLYVELNTRKSGQKQKFKIITASRG